MSRLSLFRPLCLVLLLGAPPGVLAQTDEVVEYASDEERAAAWALLRRPLVFEPGTAELTPVSVENLTSQAITIAQNPDLRVAIAIEDATRTPAAEDGLAQAREAAIEAVLAEAGVGPGQVRFVAGLERVGETLGVVPDDVEEYAVIFSPEGALSAGTAQAAVTVRSWGGAKVYAVRQRLYEANEGVACEPPPETWFGMVPTGGTFTKFYDREAVVLIAHRPPDAAAGPRTVAVAPHNVGDTTPVDLTTPSGTCP